MRLGRTFWVAVAGALLGAWMLLWPVEMLGQMRTRPRAFAGIDENGNATSVEAALEVMTQQAAVVFVGTVAGVQRVSGDGFAQAGGVVEVRFQVERAVRGAAAGQVYTLREWGGLWSATDQRYTVGSRLLMLLHAPSAAGLSSPVGGTDGAIPVRGGSLRVGSTDGTEAAASQTVDLRWVQAKLKRTLVTRPATAATGLNRVAARAQESSAATTGVDAGGQQAGSEQSVAAAGASIDSVLGMMSQWTGTGGGASDAN